MLQEMTKNYFFFIHLILEILFHSEERDRYFSIEIEKFYRIFKNPQLENIKYIRSHQKSIGAQ